MFFTLKDPLALRLPFRGQTHRSLWATKVPQKLNEKLEMIISLISCDFSNSKHGLRKKRRKKEGKKKAPLVFLHLYRCTQARPGACESAPALLFPPLPWDEFTHPSPPPNENEINEPLHPSAPPRQHQHAPVPLENKSLLRTGPGCPPPTWPGPAT